MIGVGDRVRIVPTESEGALREGSARVKLPTLGTVVREAGTAEFSSLLVYVDGLKTTRRIRRERLEPVSLVDLLGGLDG